MQASIATARPILSGEVGVIGATMFVRATRADGDQQPFGHYVIIRSADGQAIGGIGFKGQPDGGTAEIGYGLAPSGRGSSFAAEALPALADLAREHGLSRLVADTREDNTASRRTLEHAGFTITAPELDRVAITHRTWPQQLPLGIVQRVPRRGSLSGRCADWSRSGSEDLPVTERLCFAKSSGGPA